tara:strand:+ start:289 stop:633 length:345 start_codon:yes stop_codon:yes gene_type:complete
VEPNSVPISDDSDDHDDLWDRLARQQAVICDQDEQLKLLWSKFGQLRSDYDDRLCALAAEVGSVRTRVEEVHQQLCSFEDAAGRTNGELRVLVQTVRATVRTLVTLTKVRKAMK